jgi:hypothetical protein
MSGEQAGLARTDNSDVAHDQFSRFSSLKADRF